MTPDDHFDSATLTRLRRNLRKWYIDKARDLPWRRTGNPYHIWISEVMLQQTTVAAVVPYFERFLNQFPTVQQLADAEQEEVLRNWEGLGYYSRARNIHKTAKLIVADFGGEFPGTVDELLALPGIGRYTAGAIVSFAFNRPAPIVEANTLRLYCRLLSYDGDPRSTAGQKVLWRFAEELVPPKEPAQFNNALMELGALVCTPEEPSCSTCPLRSCCRAFADGRQAELPVVTRRRKITPVIEASVAIEHDGRYLLRQNPAGQRWADMWDFVRFELHNVESLIPEKGFRRGQPLQIALTTQLEASVAEQCGRAVRVDEFLTEIRHSVTRFRIRLQCVRATFQSTHQEDERQSRWVNLEEIGTLPLSVTGRKLADLISDQPTSST